MINVPIGSFEVSENKCQELQGKKIGEKVRGIINIQCVEKTKSYTILKIKHVSIIQTKRVF